MPLDAMREQLSYWKREREAARESRDTARIELCERFIRQCEKVIAALQEAAQRPHVPTAPPDAFFR